MTTFDLAGEVNAILARGLGAVARKGADYPRDEEGRVIPLEPGTPILMRGSDGKTYAVMAFPLADDGEG